MHARTRALTHHSYTLKKKNPFVYDFSLNIYHGEKNLIPKINSLTTMLGGETCKTAVISLLYKSHYMFCIRFIHLAYVFSDACMYSRRKKMFCMIRRTQELLPEINIRLEKLNKINHKIPKHDKIREMTFSKSLKFKLFRQDNGKPNFSPWHTSYCNLMYGAYNKAVSRATVYSNNCLCIYVHAFF